VIAVRNILLTLAVTLLVLAVVSAGYFFIYLNLPHVDSTESYRSPHGDASIRTIYHWHVLVFSFNAGLPDSHYDFLYNGHIVYQVWRTDRSGYRNRIQDVEWHKDSVIVSYKGWNDVPFTETITYRYR